MDQLQKEHERHKQTYDELNANYEALNRHCGEKEKEANELKSQCSELQGIVEKLRDELYRTKQELSTLQSDQVPGNEHDATIAELQNNHKLLISEKDAAISELVTEKRKLKRKNVEEINLKDTEIADLKLQKRQLEKQLESRLAHKHASVTPTTDHIVKGSSKDAELLQGCTSETASPTTSTSALITVTPKSVSVMVKQKEQSTDAGVGSLSEEYAHSGVS